MNDNNSSFNRLLHTKVKIGNWQEEMHIEEDRIHDFIQKAQSGNLASERLLNIKVHLMKEVQLSMPTDGLVIPGDTYMIINTCEHGECSLAAHPIILNTHLTTINFGLTAAIDLPAKTRNCFSIERVIDHKKKCPILYGENIYIFCNLPEKGKMYLESSINILPRQSCKSLQQEVSLSSNPSHYSMWKIETKDANWRMELEGSPVKVNQEIIFTHVFTNRHLGVERSYNKMTIFGEEYEIAAHPYLKFGIADQRNLWTLKCRRHNL